MHNSNVWRAANGTFITAHLLLTHIQNTASFPQPLIIHPTMLTRNLLRFQLLLTLSFFLIESSSADLSVATCDGCSKEFRKRTIIIGVVVTVVLIGLALGLRFYCQRKKRLAEEAGKAKVAQMLGHTKAETTSPSQMEAGTR